LTKLSVAIPFKQLSPDGDSSKRFQADPVLENERSGSPIEETQHYNLASDIGETNNIASAMPNKVRELERQMSDYLKSVKFDVHADAVSAE